MDWLIRKCLLTEFRYYTSFERPVLYGSFFCFLCCNRSILIDEILDFSLYDRSSLLYFMFILRFFQSKLGAYSNVMMSPSFMMFFFVKSPFAGPDIRFPSLVKVEP